MATKKAKVSTDTKETVKSESKMILKGARKGGKVFLAGKYLSFGDELEITKSMQADKNLMKVITNSLKAGFVSK